MSRANYEFFEYAAGYGYAVYETEDGYHWEFLEPMNTPFENPAVAGMGPFPTRSKALEEAARDWQQWGGVSTQEDEEYALRLLHAADHYRYEEANDD
jgi:hypothetical protein